MDRRLTAPALEEGSQRVAQLGELLEVVVVGDLSAQPLPDRLDRHQVGAVGGQEEEAEPGLPRDEREERGAAMPGRAIEDHDDQDIGVGAEQLATELLEEDTHQPGCEAAMEPAREGVEGAKEMDFLMGAGPHPRQWLLAPEAPLLAECRGELDGHLVFEDDGQVLRVAVRQTQEPSEEPFFFARRQAGTAGSRWRGLRSRAPS